MNRLEGMHKWGRMSPILTQDKILAQKGMLKILVFMKRGCQRLSTLEKLEESPTLVKKQRPENHFCHLMSA